MAKLENKKLRFRYHLKISFCIIFSLFAVVKANGQNIDDMVLHESIFRYFDDSASRIRFVSMKGDTIAPHFNLKSFKFCKLHEDDSLFILKLAKPFFSNCIKEPSRRPTNKQLYSVSKKNRVVHFKKNGKDEFEVSPIYRCREKALIFTRFNDSKYDTWQVWFMFEKGKLVKVDNNYLAW